MLKKNAVEIDLLTDDEIGALLLALPLLREFKTANKDIKRDYVKAHSFIMGMVRRLAPSWVTKTEPDSTED